MVISSRKSTEMTYLKGWCFLPVAGFLLLVVVPAAPEVVDSMSDCAEFFLEGTPPEVPGILESGEILDRDRYKTICQTFENRRRFVTLYDTVNRIPVFSAYKYRGHKPRRPNTGWKIEPQLEEMNTANMRDDIYRRQASNDDYKSNSTINNRGHLFPVIHAFEEDDKKSTFTLTNIVPQAVSFNNGRWQKMESCMQCVMQKYCINNNNAPEGYVVTGAKPSNNNKLKNRVNIPSFLWTAFCCYSSKINKWLASAHWGDNVAEQPGSEYMQTITLEQLKQKLSTGEPSFDEFPNTQCPQTETVTEFYPGLNAEKKTCTCPPHVSTTAPPSTTPKTTLTPTTPVRPTSTQPTTTMRTTGSLSTTLPTTGGGTLSVSSTTIEQRQLQQLLNLELQQFQRYPKSFKPALNLQLLRQQLKLCQQSRKNCRRHLLRLIQNHRTNSH